MSLSELTWDSAIDRLAVYTAMEDAQLAHNCETVVRAEIERLRASLDEAVGVLRQIADRAGDGRRTASLPVIAREARDFITKHGGGS